LVYSKIHPKFNLLSRTSFNFFEILASCTELHDRSAGLFGFPGALILGFPPLSSTVHSKGNFIWVAISNRKINTLIEITFLFILSIIYCWNDQTNYHTSHCPTATLYRKSKTPSQLLDIRCIFVRQTTFHLEDCLKNISFFVNQL